MENNPIKHILNMPIPTLFEIHEAKALQCDFCKQMYAETEAPSHGIKLISDKSGRIIDAQATCEMKVAS